MAGTTTQCLWRGNTLGRADLTSAKFCQKTIAIKNLRSAPRRIAGVNLLILTTTQPFCFLRKLAATMCLELSLLPVEYGDMSSEPKSWPPTKIKGEKVCKGVYSRS